MFKGFGKLTPYEEDEYYKAFFVNKENGIKEKIKELQEMEKRLGEEINKLSEKPLISSQKIGIDIKALNLFKCIDCKSSMGLSQGNIINNQIINGVLKCGCGREYYIEDGILIVKNQGSTFTANYKYDSNHIREYVNFTDISYLDNLYKGLEWANKKINFNDFKGKTLLELGSGLGFFLRTIYNELPEDCVYIAVDHDIERHLFLKNVFEKANFKKNIIFICSDFLQIPIGDHTIDVVLDCSGTSNYSFDHEEFLLDSIDRYVKKDAALIGTFLLFKNFSVESHIEDKFRKNFQLKTIKDKLKELKYNTINEKTSDYMDKGGKYESYFVEGEKIFTYIFMGKRLG